MNNLTNHSLALAPTYHYAGIGSRETPPAILDLMRRLAKRLGELGYTLRSGGCTGADTAFENGASGYPVQLYLPWPGYNGHSTGNNIIPPSAFTLASKFHPAWERCSNGARKLHARNGQIILDTNLNHPVDFVLCWHNGTGGTLQGVRIAQYYGIPVINLANPDWREQICSVINKNKEF
jgi:hypothetical protein